MISCLSPWHRDSSAREFHQAPSTCPRDIKLSEIGSVMPYQPPASNPLLVLAMVVGGRMWDSGAGAKEWTRVICPLYSVPIATTRQKGITYLLCRIYISLVECGAIIIVRHTPYTPVWYEMHPKLGVDSRIRLWLYCLSSCPMSCELWCLAKYWCPCQNSSVINVRVVVWNNWLGSQAEVSRNSLGLQWLIFSIAVMFLTEASRSMMLFVSDNKPNQQSDQSWDSGETSVVARSTSTNHHPISSPDSLPSWPSDSFSGPNRCW